MRPPAFSPLAWKVVGTLAAGVVVVLAALQVGTGRESMVLALLAATSLGVVAVFVPQGLLLTGSVLVFGGGFSFAGVPLPDVGAGMIIVGILMSTKDVVRPTSTFVFLLSMLFAWFMFVWLTGESDSGSKRLLSLTLWLLLIAVTSIAPPPALSKIAYGLLLGLVIAGPMGAVMGSGYGDRWGGLIGDPNTFAMVVAITTPLIAGQLGLRRWQGLAIWMYGTATVIVTDSRTGMLAIATAAGVYALAPALRLWVLTIPVVSLLVASNLPDGVARAGRWEERAGSDALRQELDAASTRQILDSPWTGHGLGRGRVDLATYGDPPQELSLLLHNSYKSLITEMGIVGMGLYTAIAFGAALQAIRGNLARGPLAAMTAGAVMATQLGEVLLAVPMALAFGFAWSSETQVPPGQGIPTRRTFVSSAVAAR